RRVRCDSAYIPSEFRSGLTLSHRCQELQGARRGRAAEARRGRAAEHRRPAADRSDRAGGPPAGGLRTAAGGPRTAAGAPGYWASMETTYSHIVVGAGALGSATAYALAKAGAGRVLVVEQYGLGHS